MNWTKEKERWGSNYTTDYTVLWAALLNNVRGSGEHQCSSTGQKLTILENKLRSFSWFTKFRTGVGGRESFNVRWTAELWKQLPYLTIKEVGSGQRRCRCWVSLALQHLLYSSLIWAFDDTMRRQQHREGWWISGIDPFVSVNVTANTKYVPRKSARTVSWVLGSPFLLLCVEKMTSTWPGFGRAIQATLLAMFPDMEVNALLK